MTPISTTRSGDPVDICTQLAATYSKYGSPVFANFCLADLAADVPYEAGVFVLADIEGNVVLIRRKPHPDWPGVEAFWWLPGGGHEGDEGLDEAAVREFWEETGLEVRIERILLATLNNERFFKLWFRGQAIAGAISALSDPCDTTAEAAAFSPTDIPVETLASDIDKLVLAHEGFIDHPIPDLLAKYGLARKQSL